jgi:hypothetical protein
LLDERSYQPTPSRRTLKELPAAPKIFKTKFKFNSYTIYWREDGNSML